MLDSLNLLKNSAAVNTVVGRLTCPVSEFIAVTGGSFSDSCPLKALENRGLGKIEIGVGENSQIGVKP